MPSPDASATETKTDPFDSETLLKELNLCKYKNEVLKKMLSLEESEKRSYEGKFVALKWHTEHLQEELKSTQEELHFYKGNIALEVHEMDLNGALGRMIQELTSIRRESILARLSDKKGDIIKAMDRHVFISRLRSKTLLLTQADLQVLSLRFSDGVNVLVQDFVAFTRDLLTSKVKDGIDSHGNLLKTEKIMKDLDIQYIDACVETEVPYPNIEEILIQNELDNMSKSSVVSPKQVQESLKAFDALRKRRVMEETTSKETDRLRSFRGDSTGSQLRHLDLQTSVIRSTPYKPLSKPTPEKKSPFEAAYDEKPEMFALTLMAHAVIGYGSMMNNFSLKQALMEILPTCHPMDIVSVEMAVANKFDNGGRCPIVAVLKHVSRGKMTALQNPRVLQTKAKEREEQKQRLQIERVKMEKKLEEEKQKRLLLKAKANEAQTDGGENRKPARRSSVAKAFSAAGRWLMGRKKESSENLQLPIEPEQEQEQPYSIPDYVHQPPTQQQDSDDEIEGESEDGLDLLLQPKPSTHEPFTPKSALKSKSSSTEHTKMSIDDLLTSPPVSPAPAPAPPRSSLAMLWGNVVEEEEEDEEPVVVEEARKSGTGSRVTWSLELGENDEA